jgi:TRAP-type C4-dicarboxylate transport system permease small subunit
VKKFLNGLFKGIEIMIAILLAVMIILLFLNVVLRYVFSKGFVWSEEVTRICFIFLVYFGSIGAMRDNRHLIVETVLVRVPEVAQKILYVIIQGIIIWMMSILVIGSWSLAVQTINDHWLATGFPTFIVWLVGLIMAAAIIIISLASLFRLIFLKESVAELIKIADDGEVS